MEKSNPQTTKTVIICILLFVLFMGGAIAATENVGFQHNFVMQIGFICLIWAGMPLGYLMRSLHD